MLLVGKEEEEDKAAVLAALPGSLVREPASSRDLGEVATATCLLTGGVLPVPVQGPAPPGAGIEQHGDMKTKVHAVTKALVSMPAWGWRCCAVGDAGPEWDGTLAKEHSSD